MSILLLCQLVTDRLNGGIRSGVFLPLNDLDVDLPLFTPPCLALHTCSHIDSDAKCPGSLGCDDLDISVSGLAYYLESSNVVLTVEPKKSVPPFGPGCVAAFRRTKAEDSSGGSADEEWGHNQAADKSFGHGASKHTDAKLLSGYAGQEEPLPQTVWVLNETYDGGNKPAVVVYGGTASVVDRRTKRQVATGWMDFVQVKVIYDDEIPPKPTNDGWSQISSSDIPSDPLVIRDPSVYKFTFSKEVNRAPSHLPTPNSQYQAPAPNSHYPAASHYPTAPTPRSQHPIPNQS